jgi:hypothetical protein
MLKAKIMAQDALPSDLEKRIGVVDSISDEARQAIFDPSHQRTLGARPVAQACKET